MSWINTKDRLPEEGKYVIAKHNRGTWRDSDDQENVNTVVVKLIKGITESDRVLMREGKMDNPESAGWRPSEGRTYTKRSEIYRSEDVQGNNLVPYCWDSFGPDKFFGQTITHWMPIPLIKK